MLGVMHVGQVTSSVPTVALVQRWEGPGQRGSELLWPWLPWQAQTFSQLCWPDPVKQEQMPTEGHNFDWGFLLFQVTLPEHTPAGSILLTVSATDPDSGSNGDVTFHLAVPSPDIAIDPSNGVWG